MLLLRSVRLLAELKSVWEEKWKDPLMKPEDVKPETRVIPTQTKIVAKQVCWWPLRISVSSGNVHKQQETQKPQIKHHWGFCTDELP